MPSLSINSYSVGRLTPSSRAAGVILPWLRLSASWTISRSRFARADFSVGGRIGLTISAFVAAVTALVINIGAYTTEIVRAGIESVQPGQIEAARALGLRPIHVVLLVVMLPALERVYPALVSQFVLLMLASSITSQISAEELTAIVNRVQSDTFRSFEVYVVAGVLYGVLSGGGASAASGQPSASVANGKSLFIQSCATCHGIQAQGTSQAPSLIGAGAAAVDAPLSLLTEYGYVRSIAGANVRRDSLTFEANPAALPEESNPEGADTADTADT